MLLIEIYKSINNFSPPIMKGFFDLKNTPYGLQSKQLSKLSETSTSRYGTHCVKSAQIRSYFWSVFSRIWTEYGEIQSISPCSVQMRENEDQNNSDYGHFSRNALHISSFSIVTFFIRFLNLWFHYTWC